MKQNKGNVTRPPPPKKSPCLSFLSAISSAQRALGLPFCPVLQKQLTGEALDVDHRTFVCLSHLKSAKPASALLTCAVEYDHTLISLWIMFLLRFPTPLCAAGVLFTKESETHESCFPFARVTPPKVNVFLSSRE